MLKFKRAIIMVFFMYLGSFINANAQKNNSFLIQGHITNYKNIELKIGAGKELILFTKDKVEIDKLGDFKCWVPNLNTMGYVSLTYGEEFSINFYVNNSDSIRIDWSDQNPTKTLKISANNDVIDYATINWLNKSAEFGKKDFALDSTKTIEEYLNKIKAKHKEENELLKTIGFDNTTSFYDQYATDIFYKNLSLIINSNFYREIDFSRIDPSRSFPPVVLYNHSFYSKLDSNYKYLLNANPTMDTNLILRRSFGQTERNFINTYHIINNILHFEKSFEFRKFIDNYFNLLFKEIYYRGLITDLRPKTYLKWLNSLKIHPKMIDWLYAVKCEKEIANYNISSKDELYNEINDIKSTRLQNELLLKVAEFDNIQKNMQAPMFSFLGKTGETVSLSEFTGKFVYINFWDSNCAPCIDDILRYSKSLAETYKNNNVVFLHLSLDDNQATWIKSLKKINPIGFNGRLVKGWQDNAVKDYAIFAIPKHVIISPEGKIINSNAGLLSSLFETNPFKD